MAKARQYIVGQKFGLLTVEKLDHVGRHGHAYWFCRCDCGNTKVVRGGHLKKGNVKSCGCLPTHKTHGEARTRLYNIWNNMKQRCTNQNAIEYGSYGGRGISVCDAWSDSFEVFRDWAIENGYADNLSIDRIDNNGNYEPSNCRWATAVEQANNTRKNRFITYNGETHSVTEWGRILHIKQSTLSARLNKYGWSVEDALGKETRNYGFE